jgi:type IV secretory pathway VirB2 component (pilin)
MATNIRSAASNAQDAQEQYFRVTDQVPGSVWYWAAVASIIVSATLFLTGRRDWSIFVGQWPPTFLLFGLYHKLIGTGD